MELEKDISGVIKANDENKIKTIQIGWDWPYETGNNEKEIEQNDKTDTKDAMQIKNYTFNVVVSGSQVMPEE